MADALDAPVAPSAVHDGPRVAMLIHNSGRFDTRVRKEATSLAARGITVRVIALADPELPERELVGAVEYVRIARTRWFLQRGRDGYLARRQRAREAHLARTARIRRRRARVGARHQRRVARAGSLFARIAAGRLDAAALRGAMERRRRRRERIRAWRRSASTAGAGRRLRPAIAAAADAAIRAVDVAFTVRRFQILAGRGGHRALRRAVARGSRRVARSESEAIGGWARGTRRIHVRHTEAQRWTWLAYRDLALRLSPVFQHIDYARAVTPVLVEFDPDVVHAHDVSTLHAAQRYARRAGAALVYDAHELELHRNTTWTPLKRLMTVIVEWRGIRAATAVITVSDGIADELARFYRMRRPHVVMNSPPLEAARTPPPLSLKTAAGLGHDDRLIVYVGNVVRGRGLDQLVEALPFMPADIHIGLLGPRAPELEELLVDRAAELGCAGRVHLFGPLASALVPAALSTADATVIPIQNVCRSYDLAMPNKLFDGVMAGVPVAVARLSEMRRFVERHALGSVFDERDPRAIAIAADEVTSSLPAGIANGEALADLQREVSWEAQERVLVALYAAIRLRERPVHR